MMVGQDNQKKVPCLACEQWFAYGSKSQFSFCFCSQTVDLFENQNMAQVLTTMFKLSSASMKKGYNGPKIGVKIAEQNIREHDEAKMREGRNVIGLQVWKLSLISIISQV